PPTGRWEQPITSPAGTAIYPALPGDGPQAADIFTNPPQVCNATPPCIQWNTAQQQTCVQTQQVQVGTTQQCTAYVDVPVFGDVCVQYQQGQTGWAHGACNTFQTQTTYVNGACNTWQTVPDYATQCQMVTIADPTPETGFRQVQQCQQVQIGSHQVCTAYDQIPVDTQVCTAWDQVPVFGQQCVQTQNQQIGTTQQCTATIDVPVFQDQCVQYQTQTVNTPCAQTDPNFICPPQNITADN